MHYRLQRFNQLFVLLAICAGGTGCNSDDRQAVFPAGGQVLYEGKPAAGAMVVLHPVEATETPERPLGYADEQGKFALTTYTTHDGAPPGEYVAGIVWIPAAPERSITGEGPVAPEPVNKLPTRYADPKTSGLRVQIKEGPNELAPFQLTK